MSRRHFPQRGDKVNDKRRIPYANGFVVRVLYDDGPSEVIVRFDNGIEAYDYEEFRYTWTDHFGGVFELAQSGDVECVDHLVETHLTLWIRRWLAKQQS